MSLDQFKADGTVLTIAAIQNVPCSGTPCPTVPCEGSWDEDWSACSATCGNTGTQSKRFTVTKVAQYGGSCPSVTQTQACIGKCAPSSTNCVGNWINDPNDKCSAICGLNNNTGTINQIWETITAAAYGGNSCPSGPRQEPCSITCASPSQTPTTPTVTSDSSSSTIGIVIGVVVGVAAIGGGVYYYNYIMQPKTSNIEGIGGRFNIGE